MKIITLTNMPCFLGKPAEALITEWDTVGYKMSKLSKGYPPAVQYAKGK